MNKLVAMVKEGVADAVWVECKSLFKLKCSPVFEKVVSTTPPGQCSELLQFVCGWTADECSALLKSINPEGTEGMLHVCHVHVTCLLYTGHMTNM